MKRILIAFTIALLLFSFTAPVALAKPSNDKPTPATNVELVKKISLRGKPEGRGRPARQAATGVLGTPQCSGDRYALVIGISDYPGEANDLDFADDDAQAVYETLTNLYNYDSDNVELLLNNQATYNAIQEEITSIANDAGNGDEVVFYFSGHGAKGKADDGDKEKVDEAIVCYDGYIWDGDLAGWFSGFNPSVTIVFIFDTCLSGGMTDLKGSNRVINMASSENGSAFEGDWGGGHGQFTHYFIIEGMQDGWADIHDHNENTDIYEPDDVTIEEAFDYAKNNCWRQSPTISDGFENDLLP